MNIKQALAFRVAGKALRDMSSDDWRQLLTRLRGERAMLAMIREGDISDEQDQRFHASADRLGDLIAAIKIICTEG